MKEIVEKWDCVWKNYYEKLETLSILRKVLLSFLFALFTGISGQIYLKLPFTPVPLTLQVFSVLLAGILLGKNFGALSQIFYFIFGVSGINWFFASGAGLLRPTSGYIIGFIFAAYFIGKFYGRKKSFVYSYMIMLAGLSIIYFSGCLFLSAFLKFSIKKSFLLGVLPFIPFDLLKVYFAVILGNSIVKNRGSFYEKV